MTEGQYRCIVAYMNFWTPQYPHLGIDQAIKDCGIADDKEGVLRQLWAACWPYSPETGLLKYDD